MTADRDDGVDVHLNVRARDATVIDLFLAANGVTRGALFQAWAVWVDAQVQQVGWTVQDWPPEAFPALVEWFEAARAIDASVQAAHIRRAAAALEQT